MLQFNELRVLQDKKYLLIDVQVQELSYYDNVYIRHIEVNTQNSFNENNIFSGNSKISPINFTPSLDFSDENLRLKHYRGYIPIDGLADSLFFICVHTTDNPAEDTPCCGKEKTIIGVTYDKEPIYIKGMKLLTQLQECQPSDELKDYILLNKAFDLSLKAGNYANVKKYWQLLTQVQEPTKAKNCGCHGVF